MKFIWRDLAEQRDVRADANTPSYILETKSELFIPFTPPPSLSLSRLLLDVTLRGLLENACDHSSRLLPWQPGPTHPTRHSHSVKHPLSEFEGPVHGATRAFAQTDMNRFLHLKGFPERGFIPGLLSGLLSFFGSFCLRFPFISKSGLTG